MDKEEKYFLNSGGNYEPFCPECGMVMDSITEPSYEGYVMSYKVKCPECGWLGIITYLPYKLNELTRGKKYVHWDEEGGIINLDFLLNTGKITREEFIEKEKLIKQRHRDE